MDGIDASRPVRTLVALVLLLAAGCSTAEFRSDVPEASGSAEILWDRYGIPHIFAEDDRALAFAFGWAQARSHGELLLRLVGSARARGAEYWGESALAQDRWYATLALPETAREAYLQQPSDMRAYLDAFAEGINAYAAAHPDSIPAEVRPVLPVGGLDVMGNALAALQLFSPARQRGARWAEPPASNAWAIAPVRSASGKALLLANPHLPWSGGFTWFEAQLSAPGLNAYGATLVGLPVLEIAFNDHLGWTHTVNTQDVEDLYELQLAEGGYRWDGAIRNFEEDTVLLRVRLPEGGLRVERLIRRRSVHGPVIAERVGRALALRQSARGRYGALGQWWAMMRARDRPEFERALARHQISGFNTLYADAEGEILFSYGGITPQRPRSDPAFWAGVVPGDRASLLWETVHEYPEMPRLANPATGWLHNANEGPWTATIPHALSPDSYPPYYGPRDVPLRPQQSIRLVRDSGPLTLERMIELKHTTEMELARRLLPELIDAGKQGDAEARAAAGVLERWDGTTLATSRGGVLFQAWYVEMGRRAGPEGIFARAWSPEDPLRTPSGLRDGRIAARALSAAAREVRERWVSTDVEWGEVHRLRRDGLDLPASGGPGELGVFRVLAFREDRDGRRVPFHGDSYVAAIEFSQPVRALALLGYGNASKTGSPHRTDQLELLSRQSLRPVWRTRDEILARLRDRETVRR